MKKVVIVENIKTIREGIKIFINRFSELNCIESFSEYNQLQKDIEKINPDILLIDLHCKNIQILDEIRKLKNNYPHIIIIVLTMNEENDLLFDALSNGASAYIHKNAPSQKLIRILNEAANGKLSINSLIARRTIKYITENKIASLYHSKELNLLNKVIEGNNILAIEKSLDMSSDEIKTNFNYIYQKLFKYGSEHAIGISN